MCDDPGADLDRRLIQAGRRPSLDRLRQTRRPHEVTGIASERMKPKPHNRVPAFLDVLPDRAAPVAEGDHAPGRVAQPGDDEADAQDTFAAGQQSGVGGDSATVEPELQAAVEIKPKRPVNRFTRRVRHMKTLKNTKSRLSDRQPPNCCEAARPGLA